MKADSSKEDNNRNNGVSDRVFSVSEYIALLNIGLKKSKAKIIGEVSERKIASSGHVYFSLKDEQDGAIINSIIWKSTYNMYGIKLEDGIKIIGRFQYYRIDNCSV